MQSYRSTPLLLGLLTVLLAAAAAGPLYLLWTGAERRLIETNHRHSALWNWLPPLEEFTGYCREAEEASDQALRRKSLRAQAHGTRLRLFALTLQAKRMKEEADVYRSEARGLNTKDLVFSVPLFLYDMESTPAPDSAESRSIRSLRLAAESYLGRPPDIDWYRPALLKRFVGAKKTLAQGDPDSKSAAEAEFTEVLRYAPDFAPAHYLRGKARLDLGETSPALTDFRQAAVVDPGMAAAHRWAAEALAKLGRINEAIVEADKALAKDPEYVEVREFKERLTRR